MSKTGLNPKNLDSVATRFRILGVPLRLQILNELSDGERTVTALVEATGSTQPNVSKHLTTLLAHRMVKREKRGNSAYYSVADPAVFELCEIVCGNIERALDEELRAFGG
ncbi:MAG: helix-turn-helix transcriptional regulator [Deltaproteobacteria bacterium]|nr:helix-turn-helix transcriptional regulator [Deltaproteobacteria bacterium]MBW2211511.1 helix-turn-helix transcriptional regulator [Deltaproteobacteria bacterium]MBW2214499.1 helix-turn-helix transcriptional regulator [Deltaproteobacteria bacterium]MBW2379607.1 helix-turn-helix transcriptional regulator [Deltaproteobacteria bacterium]MBW2551126.1 helix-turn-helix transcriptional regulator [Deltaproteobacteria bacterium]